MVIEREYAGTVALVGDVVGSRSFEQAALLEALAGALAWLDRQVVSRQSPALTVGDEFQATYATPAAALDAGLLIQLRLGATELPRPGGSPAPPELRMGIGWGEVMQTAAAAAPFGQSGSAWWAARDALDQVEAATRRSGWPRSLRTAFRSGDPRLDGVVNGFLLCRDDLLGRMDRRDLRVTLGLFLGERQADIGAELGISQPAVARRQGEKGAQAVVRAHEAIRDVLG